MATVLLVRHGRTTANSDGVLAGWSPGVGLDTVGESQARQVADTLSRVPVAQIVSSPLLRCQQTAAALADARTLEVETQDALGECKYGAWTGQPIKDLAKEPLWQTVQQQPSAVTFPSSPQFATESISAMQHRAVSFIRQRCAELDERYGPSATWIAVSHGDVIKAVLADALGSHLDQFQRIVVGPGSLSAIRYAGARPFVLRTNDTSGDVADLVPASDEAAAESDATVGGTTGTTAADEE